MSLNVFLKGMILMNNTCFTIASYIRGIQGESETHPWDFLYEKGGETPLDHLAEQVQRLGLDVIIIAISLAGVYIFCKKVLPYLFKKK